MKRILFLLCVLLAQSMFALVPPLEREVNLELVNEPVQGALQKIREQTGLVFSYKPSLIGGLGPVTLKLRQKTVREALALIFPKNITYKQKSNYIILKEKPAGTKTNELSGYVVDKNTSQKLANVTIFDKTTLTAVTTDKYGYYSITVPDTNQCLKVEKAQYQDTCVQASGQGAITNISIAADTRKVPDTSNMLNDISGKINTVFKKFKGYISTINVKDTFVRRTQVSLLPFVGSNGILSGNVYNDYSFNILGGYSRGNRVLEVGGVFNVNRKSMKGLQAAGFFNVVGDSADGVQLAGMFNITGRRVSGMQAAGFMNLNMGKVEGIQAAGFANVNGDVKGASFAGFMNITRHSLRGSAQAGMLNVVGDTLQGLEMAGFCNLAKYGKQAVQVSSFINSVHSGTHIVQISAMVNSAPQGTVLVQAGLFNLADKVSGAQLGFFNYSNKSSGVPVGFLSIVKGGVHQFEIYGDELFTGNIGFRTGVKAFHNIFSFGAGTGPGARLWQFGYGAGTSFRMSKNIHGEAAVTVHHVSKGAFYHATSELFKFHLGAEVKLMDNVSLAFGPTYNLYWGDALLPDYAGTYSKIAPYKITHRDLPNQFILDGWVGGRIALRFL